MAPPGIFSERQSAPTLKYGSPAGPSLPLVGPRVRIRPLERLDLDRRQQWPPFNDPLYLIWDMPPCSKRENDGWFAQLTDGRHRLAYGLVDQQDSLIGMLSLREISWNRSARLGIALSSRHVSQGYGTEVLRLFFPYFFLTLGFRKMVLDVGAANVRAVKCYLRLGFHQTGSHWQLLDGPLDPELLERPEYAPLRPSFRWFFGQPETLYLDMELTREEWEENR